MFIQHKVAIVGEFAHKANGRPMESLCFPLIGINMYISLTNGNACILGLCGIAKKLYVSKQYLIIIKYY